MGIYLPGPPLELQASSTFLSLTNYHNSYFPNTLLLCQTAAHQGLVGRRRRGTNKAPRHAAQRSAAEVGAVHHPAETDETSTIGVIGEAEIRTAAEETHIAAATDTEEEIAIEALTTEIEIKTGRGIATETRTETAHANLREAAAASSGSRRTQEATGRRIIRAVVV